MKIGVCIKQVPDTSARLVVSDDKKGIKEDGVKFVISPYDEFALEEALRTKEKNPGSEVVVMTVGPKRAQEALRTALAMGCDRAVHIPSDGMNLDSLVVAKLLARACQKEQVEVIFSGKHAADDDAGMVSQMLAEKLSWPHVTAVSKFSMEPGSRQASLERDVDGGAKELWKVTIPAVIAANKGLNEPRYASLKGIMAAKSKPIQNYTAQDLDLSSNDLQPKVQFFDYQIPVESRKTKIYKGVPLEQAVKEVVKALRDDSKVI